MIIKRRSPTLRHVSRKGNFTREKWNHLWCLLNTSHFNLTVCTAAMAKRSPQDSREERITTKSKLMMNFMVKTPSLMSSSTSVSPVKRYYGKQNPWKSVVAENRPRKPGKETESCFSTDYSKLDFYRALFFQGWKREGTTHDRSRRPDTTFWRMVQQIFPRHEETLLDGTLQSVNYGEPLRDRSERPDNNKSHEAANSQNFIMGSDATKLLNRMNNHVRKRQKRISNVAGDGEEHFMIWGMFLAVMINKCSDIHGNNFQDNQNSIMNTSDLTLKNIFDISAKLVQVWIRLVGESFMEISVIDCWPKPSSIFNARKSTSFQILCCVLEGPSASEVQWILEDKIGWITTSQSYGDWLNQWRAYWIRVEYFPRIHLVAVLRHNRRSIEQDWKKHRKLSQEIFHICRCSTTFLVTKKTMKKKFGNAEVVPNMQRPCSEKKWYSRKEDPQEIWDNIAEKMLLVRRFSVLRHYCPEVNSEAKDTRKTVDSLCCHSRDKWDNFSHNCFCKSAQSLRAVANMSEECESPHDQSGKPDVIINCSQWNQDGRSFENWRPKHIKTFHCNDMKSESKVFHKLIEWVNFASQRQRPQKSWKYWPAQRMEETPRRGILGWYWSCNSERIDIPSNSIECNYPSTNTSSLLSSKSCFDWELEKSHMKKHTCLLDHHQRSRYVHDWARREVLHLINHTNQSQDQDNLTTRTTCLLLKMKHVPFMRDQCEILPRRTLFFNWIRASWYHARRDRCSNMSVWKKQNVSVEQNSW